MRVAVGGRPDQPQSGVEGGTSSVALLYIVWRCFGPLNAFNRTDDDDRAEHWIGSDAG